MFFQLGTADNLRTAFEQAGLCDIQVERLDTTLDYASEEDAIGAVFAGGPVALAYAHFDAETREDAHAYYLGTIEQHRHRTPNGHVFRAIPRSVWCSAESRATIRGDDAGTPTPLPEQASLVTSIYRSGESSPSSAYAWSAATRAVEVCTPP